MISKHGLAELDELFELPVEAATAATRQGGVVAAVPATPRLLVPENPALSTKGILRRRSAPIMGYVGLNGQGKTFSMIRDSLLSLAIGRRVLSTVTILDPATGEPHPNFERFTSWEQLHDFRDGDVLLDEITGIMDARDSGMPKHVRRLLPQMRRANVMVRWTGIDFDNTDRRLRQLSQAVVRCRGHFPNSKLVRGEGVRDAVSMWAPNRAFVLTTFDAQTLTDSGDARALTEDSERKRRAKVLNREFVWGPKDLTFQCYNTLDSVSAVDNSCRVCGGKPVEKTCRGH
ncbi:MULTISPECIES: hypothetical protein [unclassified Leucobacter]|uniref:hypothetical protein n=1 Tax=unclassified Leucobacter TaxID=2621730 RepID=UPI00165D8AF4|nr:MULTISPECIES: hypothetical protein [unclassified Leucobacter]MBC9928394.1 hypothetical protein [Leucobacter sp. cx-169]